MNIHNRKVLESERGRVIYSLVVGRFWPLDELDMEGADLAALKEAFDRDGVIVIPGFASDGEFPSCLKQLRPTGRVCSFIHQ